jgi:glycosyltransferase involved in cell wall biosynthesis
MIKLLIASDALLPRWDGVSSFLNEIIPRIQDTFELTVIAPDFGQLKTEYKAKIIRFNTIKKRLGDNYYASIVNPWVLSAQVKRNDIVWVQALGPVGIAGIFAAKRHHKPLIMYNHLIEWEVFPNSQSHSYLKGPINFITKMIGRQLYGMCEMIMVPSLEQAELLNLMGVRNIKKVIPLGVDTKKYKPADKLSSKMKLGISSSKFVIGYAGRLSFEKNPRTLYRAFKRISRKYPETVLLIAGGGRPELEMLFSGKENIILTGLQDDLSPYYQAMDVYVLPSLVETSSLTTMEAMASGLPVIVTPVGFIKEYINDGNNGMLFPKKNSYELSRKIEHLIKNPLDRITLGKNARQTIVENYSWEKTTEGIIKAINELAVQGQMKSRR